MKASSTGPATGKCLVILFSSFFFFYMRDHSITLLSLSLVFPLSLPLSFCPLLPSPCHAWLSGEQELCQVKCAVILSKSSNLSQPQAHL